MCMFLFLHDVSFLSQSSQRHAWKYCVLEVMLKVIDILFLYSQVARVGQAAGLRTWLHSQAPAPTPPTGVLSARRTTRKSPVPDPAPPAPTRSVTSTHHQLSRARQRTKSSGAWRRWHAPSASGFGAPRTGRGGRRAPNLSSAGGTQPLQLGRSPSCMVYFQDGAETRPASWCSRRPLPVAGLPR